MKKTLIFVFFASAIISLTACDQMASSVSGSGSSTVTTTGTGATTGATTPPGGSSQGGLTGTAQMDSEEVAFFGLINAYRVQNGLQALQESIALTQSADWMSKDMASTSNLSHTDSLGRDPGSRMLAFGYDTHIGWGENIAGGYASAQDTFNQWKNSPAHNANMLGSNYVVIGIARAQGGTYGWYWTTDFGATLDATFTP